jgi:hypothetical protein
VTDEEENIATLRRIIRAIDERDLGSIGQWVTPGFRRHDLAGAFLVGGEGGAAVTDFLRALLDALPDLRIEVLDMVASGDRLAVRYRFSGTQEGELLGLAATGAKVSFSAMNIYRFEEAKMAEVWQLWDWATVLSQIGALDVISGRSEG